MDAKTSYERESANTRHRFVRRQIFLTPCLAGALIADRLPCNDSKAENPTICGAGAIVIEAARIVSVGSASSILYLDSNHESPHATQSTLFRSGTLVAQMQYSSAIEGRAGFRVIKFKTKWKR